MEDLNSPATDFVERNKRIAEQRRKQASYTDRYKHKHTKGNEENPSECVIYGLCCISTRNAMLQGLMVKRD